jgi:hypothetical protein
VPGAEDRELFVEHSLDPELAQIGLEPRGVRFAPRALQHLEQDEVPDENIVGILNRSERANRVGVEIAQVRNPD